MELILGSKIETNLGMRLLANLGVSKHGLRFWKRATTNCYICQYQSRMSHEVFRYMFLKTTASKCMKYWEQVLKGWHDLCSRFARFLVHSANGNIQFWVRRTQQNQSFDATTRKWGGPLNTREPEPALATQIDRQNFTSGPQKVRGDTIRGCATAIHKHKEGDSMKEIQKLWKRSFGRPRSNVLGKHK